MSTGKAVGGLLGAFVVIKATEPLLRSVKRLGRVKPIKLKPRQNERRRK